MRQLFRTAQGLRRFFAFEGELWALCSGAIEFGGAVGKIFFAQQVSLATGQGYGDSVAIQVEKAGRTFGEAELQRRLQDRRAGQ